MGLFGSLARGEGKRESDVDILIEFADNSGDLFTLKRELREFLTRTFGRPVDLAREKYLRPYAREAIFRDLIDV
jgi:predicted nucleotidyltransferase